MTKPRALTVNKLTVKKVSATSLRGRLKTYMKAAKGDQMILIENRRQESKYLVDKEWLDAVMRERDAILATLEILADRELTARLLKLAETVDEDVQAGRLHTMEEVFEED
jgi:PHD/YefM family antitoxin component YafN of YafNO toxin-antitoxin module